MGKKDLLEKPEDTRYVVNRTFEVMTLISDFYSF